MTLNVNTKQNVLVYRAQRRVRYYAKGLYQFFTTFGGTSPIFIVGSGRSGTDIVAHCLSKAWDVELINEDNPKAFDNWRLKGLDSVGRSVESSRARLVIFKPIVETLRARDLLGSFSTGKVIFATRNPYDAINSMVRFFGERHIKAVKGWVDTGFSRQSEAPETLRQFISDHCHDQLSLEDASGLYWLLYNSSYQFLGLASDVRVLLVRYENLVQKPVETVKDVCDFLELKFQPSMISEIYPGSVGKNRRPSMSPDIERACLDVWREMTGEEVALGG